MLNWVIHDINGNDYHGVQIHAMQKCGCSDPAYIWQDREHTYRDGSCVGQAICCKKCGQLIGWAVNDPIFGVSRRYLGDQEHEGKNHYLRMGLKQRIEELEQRKRCFPWSQTRETELHVAKMLLAEFLSRLEADPEKALPDFTAYLEGLSKKLSCSSHMAAEAAAVKHWLGEAHKAPNIYILERLHVFVKKRKVRNSTAAKEKI